MSLAVVGWEQVGYIAFNLSITEIEIHSGDGNTIRPTSVRFGVKSKTQLKKAPIFFSQELNSLESFVAIDGLEILFQELNKKI